MRRTPPREALADLSAFLAAAHPYLDRVLFAGGWVPFFYRSLPGLGAPAHGVVRPFLEEALGVGE